MLGGFGAASGLTLFPTSGGVFRRWIELGKALKNPVTAAFRVIESRRCLDTHVGCVSLGPLIKAGFSGCISMPRMFLPHNLWRGKRCRLCQEPRETEL